MFLAPALPVSTPFIFSVKTNNGGISGSTQIKVPTLSSGSYNCLVIWGDGTTSKITTFNDAAWTHTFAGGAGTYTVQIYGLFNGISFANGGDKLKLLTISQWGLNFRLGNGSSGQHFHGCSNLTITATDVLNLTGTTSLGNTFNGCAALTTIPSANSWNTSAVTNMNFMFENATLFNQNIGAWNTSAVTTMSSMFQGAAAFNQNIGAWNTSAVTNMLSMFENAGAFNQNIGAWNTSAVTTMLSMFQGAAAFNQNIGAWSTNAVTSMTGMFQNATAFNQNIGAWHISALTQASSMFANVTLSNANYNALLAGWGAFVTPHSSVPFSGGNSHYDATSGGFNGTAGRLLLTGTYSWTVTDGGTP